MSVNVLTFGSCLSIEIVDSLEKTYGSYFKRISSVQHFRIDQFVKTYITKELNPILSSHYDIQIKPEYRKANTFDNQFYDVGFGKAYQHKSTSRLTDPILAILNGCVDFLIIDNFPDVIFKTWFNESARQQIFINGAYLENKIDGFIFNDAFINVPDALTWYEILISFYLRSCAHGKVIIIPFPFSHHHKEEVRTRAYTMRLSLESLVSEDVYIFNPNDVNEDYMKINKDPYHFNSQYYIDNAVRIASIIL
jgi:hypothetical protein